MVERASRWPSRAWSTRSLTPWPSRSVARLCFVPS